MSKRTCVKGGKECYIQSPQTAGHWESQINGNGRGLLTEGSSPPSLRLFTRGIFICYLKHQKIGECQSSKHTMYACAVRTRARNSWPANYRTLNFEFPRPRVLTLSKQAMPDNRRNQGPDETQCPLFYLDEREKKPDSIVREGPSKCSAHPFTQCSLWSKATYQSASVSCKNGYCT